MKTVTESGIEVFDLAATAYRAFRESLSTRDDLGQTLPEWDAIADDVKDDWLRVAALAIPMVEDAQGLRWADLAAELFRAFAKRQCELAEIEIPNFHGSSARSQFAWEAVARHLANLIDTEKGELDDLAEHEFKWRSWADIKASKEQV